MRSYFLQNKNLSLEGVIIEGLSGGRGQEHLAHEGLALARHQADLAGVDRHVAPAQDGEALLLGQLGEVLLALRAARRVREAYSRGVAAEGRQLHLLRRPELRRVQLVRDGREHARAIAGVIVA